MHFYVAFQCNRLKLTQIPKFSVMLLRHRNCIRGDFSGNSDRDDAWFLFRDAILHTLFFNHCQQRASTHWRNVTFSYLYLSPCRQSWLNACTAFKFILLSVSPTSVYFRITLLASSFSPHRLTPPQHDFRGLQFLASLQTDDCSLYWFCYVEHASFKGCNTCLFKNSYSLNTQSKRYSVIWGSGVHRRSFWVWKCSDVI